MSAKILQSIKVLISFTYLFFLLKQFFVPVSPLYAATVHVFMATSLVFCFKPLETEKFKPIAFIIDLILIIAALGMCWHYVTNMERLETRLEMIDEVFLRDQAAFVAGMLLVFEGVRRSVGFSLLSVILFFVFYAWYGNYFPGWTHFAGFSLTELSEIVTMKTDGLFGVTASTAVNFVFFFVMFGCIFTLTGGGSIFIDIAMLATARLKGGAAKMSLFGSALFGMVSGSAVANTTSTGVLTIPIMHRSGYSKEQAAATEAIASTGGQLMPPIMGVAAFVMADMLGVPYTQIAAAGLIPALAFYFALFIIIDLRARKTGVGNISPEDLNIDPIKPRLHLLMSPVLLISFLVAGYSAPFSAFIGSIVALIVPFARKNTHYPIKDLYSLILDITKQMAWVSVPLASVGIIMVIATQSNLAFKFVELLTEVGASNLYLSLVMVIFGCIIMGMGLPTVAAYIIGSIIFVPALTDMGVGALAANMFVMYYCVLSMVTPPVALCSYAAAALAKSDSTKTGLVAFSYALVIFLVPFSFISDPAVLWQGSTFQIIIAFIGMMLATFSWSVFLQGWLKKDLNWFERVVFLGASIALIIEKSGTWIWGVMLCVNLVIIGWCLYSAKTAKTSITHSAACK
ncbi:TRAP transporter permease [Vibrio quintilis]|uniref:DctM-like transporters n=1 Tax=Vibrio quintilis TaxID=1117707 RepID=A0A1M7YUH2_9VIBR|nr:TRAP transporter fused permease subunit [Vibrio quintilis]SHO56235.1 DctM-like transporters [Vibrio quintilis]